jgi:type I restriction enzyme S subunit
MNADRLLALYERIADAPDAVGRLRRFVLDLAVRGKLVPQDPADEPASELLKRIAADKAERAASARDRRATKIRPLADDETPFTLPSNWVWASFGDITISRDGDRIPVSRAEREQRTKVYDYYGASGVIDQIDGYLFDKPLLLIGEDGANLINRSTPIAFIARGQYWVNNHAHVLDGISETFLRYVELFVNAIDLKPYVTGTAQPKMNQAKMNSIPVAVPPLAEQHRIVAKVDELMALCDRLEAARAAREATRDRLAAASLARLNAPDPETFTDDARFALNALPALTTRPDQIKQLRQTILNLAVRGKLVPQDPADEPASVLLKRIVTELLNVEHEADYPLASGWEWVQIENCFSVSGGMQKTPARTPKANAFPYLGVGNVYRGRLDLSSVKKFELMEGELERFRLEPADILVVEGNGSASEIGRCAVWNGEVENCVHQNHIIRCRPKEVLLTPYTTLYLNSPDGMAEMKRLAITSAGLFSLSVGKIRKIPFPLPPLAEQHRIVAKVDELMALCDQLEASLTTGDATRRRLLDALLAEALAPAATDERQAA